MRPIQEVTRQLVVAAMAVADGRRQEKLKEGVALADLLRESGFDYDYKALQRWARGDVNPPAFPLLEALRLTGISVDQALHEESIDERMTRFELQLQRLRTEMQKGLAARTRDA